MHIVYRFVFNTELRLLFYSKLLATFSSHALKFAVIPCLLFQLYPHAFHACKCLSDKNTTLLIQIYCSHWLDNVTQQIRFDKSNIFFE